MTVYVGDTIHSSLQVYDDDGRLADAVVRVTVVDPLGVTVVYVSGTDEEIVHEGVGMYYLDQLATLSGDWSFTWTDPHGTTTPRIVRVEPLDVTLTLRAVRDADPDPLPVEGVVLSVFSQGWLVASGRTGADGLFTATLPPGDYTVTADLPGWTFAAVPVTLTTATMLDVLGADEGTVGTVAVEVCRIFGHVADMGGGPLATHVVVEPAGQGDASFSEGSGVGVVPSNVAVGGGRVIRTRDSDGYWEVSAIQGLIITVRLLTTGWTRTFRVPAQDTLNIRDARPDPGRMSVGVTSDAERSPQTSSYYGGNR